MARKNHKYHYLYKITCEKNGRYYIGIHSTSNLNDGYMGGGKRIKNSVKKHGKEFHIKEILEFFDTREKLVEREKEIVNLEFLKDPMCMNIKLGGEGWCCVGIQIGGDKWKKANERWKTAEGKKHLSERLKGKWKEEDYSQKIKDKLKAHWEENPAAFAGKNHKEESKIKIGEKNSINQSGNKNSQFGTKWITNDLEDKKIKKEDPIPDGWRQGRKK